MKLFLLTLLAATMATLHLHAQDREPLEVKYGKLALGEAKLMPPGRDSAAEAYVLFDKTALTVELDTEGAPFRQRRVHRRVKLIRESSFDRATIELYYRPKSGGISGLDAQIYVPDGTIVKLKRRDFVTTKISNEVSQIKFTFPQVTEGCIIEYQYLQKSEYITVPNRFQFQEDIPVRYVEYKSSILDLYQYVNIGTGVNYHVKEFKTVPRQLAGRNHKVNINTLGFYDLPAYEYQPYVNNFQDYLPYVQYQLKNFYPPGRGVQEVFTDWPQTIKSMDEWPNFGKAYQTNGFSNAAWKVAESTTTGKVTETEKAQALYDFVNKNVAWNQKHDWTSDNSPDKVLDARTGNSGEMSFLLLALLHQAEIEAFPALVSLRDQGAPIQVFPLISQFEHAMVYAKLDGEWIFLDPNDGGRPMGLPRSSALNGPVMIADPENPRWVTPEVPPARRTVQAVVVLDESGMGKIDLQSKLTSYYAYGGRYDLLNPEEDNAFPIAKEIMEKFPEAEITDKKVMNEEDKVGDLSLQLSMNVPIAQQMDDYLYVQPILINSLAKELVDTDRRLYPVDFNYPWVKRYLTTIKVPEGYMIDEMPDSERVQAEDGSMVSLFRATESVDGDIQLEFRVNVNKTYFTAAEYEVLKALYKRVIDAQDSVIVLKKAK